MRKQILTFSIVSSVLNLNCALAHDLAIQSKDYRINAWAQNREAAISGFQILELKNKVFGKQVGDAVANLILAVVSLAVEHEANGDMLEAALDDLKIKIGDMDSLYPEQSTSVKAKILSELLRTEVVVMDDDAIPGLNESIIRELEGRQIIVDLYAHGGVICIR